MRNTVVTTKDNAGGPQFVTGKPVSGAQLGKGKSNLRTGACSAVVAVVAS